MLFLRDPGKTAKIVTTHLSHMVRTDNHTRNCYRLYVFQTNREYVQKFNELSKHANVLIDLRQG